MSLENESYEQLEYLVSSLHHCVPCQMPSTLAMQHPRMPNHTNGTHALLARLPKGSPLAVRSSLLVTRLVEIALESPDAAPSSFLI